MLNWAGGLEAVEEALGVMGTGAAQWPSTWVQGGTPAVGGGQLLLLNSKG